MNGRAVITQTFQNGVLDIRFELPPVNAISVSGGLVPALHETASQAINSAHIDAIILSGGGRMFSAGADIAEFEAGLKDLDQLRALLRLIEDAPKPVVAAVHGLCLCGGLELAIAAHYRVASDDASFGFPEISLGLLPGAGGTQRSPRLVGARRALDLMLKGVPIVAAEAKELGLIDATASGDPGAHARELIRTGEFARPRPTLRFPAPDDLAEAAEAARSKFNRTEAERLIVNCVEACGWSNADDGLEFESTSFERLAGSAESRALRHAFQGRRIVRRVPGLATVTAPPVSKVAVIGGGLMGTGISIALLNAGLRVQLVEINDAARKRARALIAAAIERDVAKGKTDRAAADARIASLELLCEISEAIDADLYLEAAFEDMAVKRDVFAQIDEVARTGALLASNTSTLDIDEIARSTSRPQDVVGLHFFSPANVMRLLEIVRGAETSSASLARAVAFAGSIGKTGVVAGVCDGFIGNRLFEEYLRQAWFLLEEGAQPEQIDRAIEQFGMAMGPCRVMDLAGQDIGWSIRKRRAVTQPERPYSQVPDRLCELGRFGQKTGAGFYRYTDGRTAHADPDVTELIRAERERLGIVPRDISDSEIIKRCIYALVNEGAQALMEGVAYRPVDIDIVYLDGYGFPDAKGGPMFYADQIGLDRVLNGIRGFAGGRHGWAWKPAPLLVELAKTGRTFEDLNQL